LLLDIPSVSVVCLSMADGNYVVIKAWPAERAADDTQQLLAEEAAAHLFGCTPLIITPLAIGSGPSGSASTATPLAGISVRELISHPAWQRLPLKEKDSIWHWLAAGTLMALEQMQEDVSVNTARQGLCRNMLAHAHSTCLA
jgi:hypothetical protein